MQGMHRYFWKQIYRCIPFIFDYKPLYISASHLELVEGYFSYSLNNRRRSRSL